MLKRVFLFTLFATLFLAMTSPALAEEPLKISIMDISVWPEYDQPGVLVQYQGSLLATPTKTNPVEVYFLVPKGAGVGAACAIQSNGNHTSETWKETDADDALTKVTFKVTEPQFHVEYYYNPLPAAADKKFSFAYTAGLPTDEIDLDVQHPLKATAFTLTPDAPNSHKEQDGFTYHQYTFKQVAAGQKLSTDVAYSKSDPKPSVSSDKPASSPSAADAASSGGINPNQLIVIATFLAMAGIIIYFVWERNRRVLQPAYGRVEHYEAAPQAAVLATNGFCTQCGSPMQAGDRFCARCGTAVADV